MMKNNHTNLDSKNNLYFNLAQVIICLVTKNIFMHKKLVKEINLLYIMEDKTINQILKCANS